MSFSMYLSRKGHIAVLVTIRGKGMAGDDGSIVGTAVDNEARTLLMLFWIQLSHGLNHV